MPSEMPTDSYSNLTVHCSSAASAAIFKESAVSFPGSLTTPACAGAGASANSTHRDASVPETLRPGSNEEMIPPILGVPVLILSFPPAQDHAGSQTSPANTLRQYIGSLVYQSGPGDYGDSLNLIAQSPELMSANQTRSRCGMTLHAPGELGMNPVGSNAL